MTRVSRLVVVLTAALCLLAGAAVAQETVEVAPGIRVTKKTYSGPPNEQPFFGFMRKEPHHLQADEIFVKTVVERAGDKLRGFEGVLSSGWVALQAGDFVIAGRRFNQAYLLADDQSGIYHSFAVLAQVRYRDLDYAEELFRVAKTRPNPRISLDADYGRLMLIMRRPKDALPLLEDATRGGAAEAAPVWSNLAFARFLTGDTAGACTASVEALKKQGMLPVIKKDLDGLRERAKCQ